MFKTNSLIVKTTTKEEKESSTDESLENSFSTNDEGLKIVKNKKTKNTIKNKKKTPDICYTLNLLENSGNFIVHENETTEKLFIIKIKKVDFPDSAELFEKGRNNIGSYFKEEIGSIPDITFWNQRYYYYSLYDNGIKMDFESKIFLKK